MAHLRRLFRAIVRWTGITFKVLLATTATLALLWAVFHFFGDQLSVWFGGTAGLSDVLWMLAAFVVGGIVPIAGAVALILGLKGGWSSMRGVRYSYKWIAIFLLALLGLLAVGWVVSYGYSLATSWGSSLSWPTFTLPTLPASPAIPTSWVKLVGVGLLGLTFGIMTLIWFPKGVFAMAAAAATGSTGSGRSTAKKLWEFALTLVSCVLVYAGAWMFLPDLFWYLWDLGAPFWFLAYTFIILAVARYARPLAWIFAAMGLAMALYVTWPHLKTFFSDLPSLTQVNAGGSTDSSVTSARSANRPMMTADVIYFRPGVSLPWHFKTGETSGFLSVDCPKDLAIAGENDKLVAIVDGKDWPIADHPGENIPKNRTLKFRAVGDGSVFFRCF